MVDVLSGCGGGGRGTRRTRAESRPPPTKKRAVQDNRRGGGHYLLTGGHAPQRTVPVPTAAGNTRLSFIVRACSNRRVCFNIIVRRITLNVPGASDGEGWEEGTIKENTTRKPGKDKWEGGGEGRTDGRNGREDGKNKKKKTKQSVSVRGLASLLERHACAACVEGHASVFGFLQQQR